MATISALNFNAATVEGRIVSVEQAIDAGTRVYWQAPTTKQQAMTTCTTRETPNHLQTHPPLSMGPLRRLHDLLHAGRVHHARGRRRPVSPFPPPDPALLPLKPQLGLLPPARSARSFCFGVTSPQVQTNTY